MALAWALAVLSLLPLLDAQSPECTKFTTVPITNATLDQVSTWAPGAVGSCLLLWASLSPAGLRSTPFPASALFPHQGPGVKF